LDATFHGSAWTATSATAIEPGGEGFFRGLGRRSGSKLNAVKRRGWAKWGPEGHQIAASTARCIIYGAQCAPDSLIFLFFLYPVLAVVGALNLYVAFDTS